MKKMSIDEITANTPLSSILNWNDVYTDFTDSINIFKDTVSQRKDNLDYQNSMKVISETQFDNENLLSGKGAEVSGYYEVFLSDCDSLTEEIKGLCIDRELKELYRLADLVKKYLDKRRADLKILEDSITEEAYNKYSLSMDYEQAVRKVQSEPQYAIPLKEINNDISRYEDKLKTINNRISEVESEGSSTTFATEEDSNIDASNKNNEYINKIPDFDIDENGIPTSIPTDFSVDCHHRLNIPGPGLFYEAQNGDTLVFHYNKKTNMFYLGDSNTDWSTFDYANDIYGITPTDMKKSEVQGGIIPF